jgi:predicted nuclease of predicted toxin-antitoxin system
MLFFCHQQLLYFALLRRPVEYAVIVTKDEDFAIRSDARGAPPQILWLRIGNCRNGHLVNALSVSIAAAFEAFERGERIVEIRGR